MQFSRYEVVIAETNGYVHVNVICDDGSTFGQWIRNGTTAELDAQVQEAVARVAAQNSAPAALPAVGMVRTAAEVAGAVA